jgi:hypothetical protein
MSWVTDIPYTTPSKRALSHRVSEVSMLYGGTPLGRNAALRVSCVKLFAPPRPSQLKPRNERMEVGGRRDMTLT